MESPRYGCWSHKEITPPWEGASTDCGYDDQDQDIRCAGCYRRQASRIERDNDRRLDAVISALQTKWWNRWYGGTPWALDVEKKAAAEGCDQ